MTPRLEVFHGQQSILDMHFPSGYSNFHLKTTRDSLIRDNVDVPTSAARVHGAVITLLVIGKNLHQIQAKRRIVYCTRQDGVPTNHAVIQGSAQGCSISRQDGIEAIPARLAQTPDPLGIEILLLERVVSGGTRSDWHHIDVILQPAGDLGIRI